VDLPAETSALGPGLHVQTHPDPAARAKQLAGELAARLCTTSPEAQLLLDDLATLPRLDRDALTALAALADRVQTAERIVGRTVDRAAEAVGGRLAEAGTGLAVHPRAVRDRAAAVLAAREEAAASEERLRVAEAEAEADQARRAALAEQVADPGASDVAPMASTVDEPPARRRWLRRRPRQEAEDTSESTSLLQQVAATTDEAFGARRAAAARADSLLLLRAQRARAMETVRVAERAWRDLAGDDPVEDVEAVVRRFDPQHQDALEIARDTVGVRAVSALLSRATTHWEEGWQSFGFDEPVVAPHAMGDVVRRCSSPVVLASDAVARADDIAEAAPAATVVAVEPAG
jgi:hypothetical protein